MNYTNLLICSSLLQFIHDLSEDDKDLYYQLTWVAGNKQLWVMLNTEGFWFVGLDSILAIEIEDDLHHLLEDRVFLDDLSSRIGIGDKKMRWYGCQVIEVKTVDMIH